LFWLLFPIGAIAAWAIAECSCHTLRYLSFRHLVFPAEHGYRVTIVRYLVSVAPTSLIGLLLVALLKGHMDRTMLTLTIAAIVIAMGFGLSLLAYRKQ
jgi:phosphate starvation-inducible membrane PsiE